MKASQFISRLASLIDTVGDVEVVVHAENIPDNQFEAAAIEPQNVRSIDNRWETTESSNTHTVIKVW